MVLNIILYQNKNLKMYFINNFIEKKFADIEDNIISLYVYLKETKLRIIIFIINNNKEIKKD